MTREEAIKILERKTTIPGDGYDFSQIEEAIDMAIETLKQPEIILCKDCKFSDKRGCALWCGSWGRYTGHRGWCYRSVDRWEE